VVAEEEVLVFQILLVVLVTLQVHLHHKEIMVVMELVLILQVEEEVQEKLVTQMVMEKVVMAQLHQSQELQ